MRIINLCPGAWLIQAPGYWSGIVEAPDQETAETIFFNDPQNKIK